jgi:hypothetical protein
MRKFIIGAFAAIGVVLGGAAIAQKSVSDPQSKITTNLPSGRPGLPAAARGVLADIVSSLIWNEVRYNTKATFMTKSAANIVLANYVNIDAVVSGAPCQLRYMRGTGTPTNIYGEVKIGSVYWEPQYDTSPVRACQFGGPGVNMGAMVNSALASFGSEPVCGKIDIPIGSFSYNTTIDFGSRHGCALSGHGNITFMDSGSGTVLRYTGSGKAITASGSPPGVVGMYKLENFSLICSGCSDDGIYFADTVLGEITNLFVGGFATADKAGIHLVGSGANGGANLFQWTIRNSLIQSNYHGILMDGTGGVISIGIHDNEIHANSGYGVKCTSGNQKCAINVTNNDIEGNNLGEFIGDGVSGLILANHFESPGSNTPILIGPKYGSSNVLIAGNFINTGSSTYCIDFSGAQSHRAITIFNNTCYATHGYHLNVIMGGIIGPNDQNNDVVAETGTEGVLINQGGVLSYSGAIASLEGSPGIVMNAGEIGQQVIAASRSAPGANFGKLALVCDPVHAGSAMLVAYAGTNATPTTIKDQIGSGVTINGSPC